MFFRLKKEIGKQWTYDVINKLRNEIDKFDEMLSEFQEKITK
jgi:DNA-binding HxlR family transcriptional regulator